MEQTGDTAAGLISDAIIVKLVREEFILQFAESLGKIHHYNVRSETFV